jgi:Tol biopolymer transport system component
MLNRSTLTVLLALVAFAVPAASVTAAPGSSGAVVFSRVTEDSRVLELPDGKTEVRPAEGGLFAARNGRLNQLTENAADSEPSFSADGRTIAFVRGGDVYAMRADGSGQHALTSGSDVDGRPLVSPNGKYVVFERRGPGEGTPRDLYTVRIGGGEAHALVASPADDHEATFSPDGCMIAFVRSTAGTGGGTADDVYSVRPAGVGLRRLTHTNGLDEFAPRYFEDDESIVFSRGQSGDGPDAFADIYTMRSNGAKARGLIAGAGSAYVEDVTPSGRLVLFRRDQGLWVKALPVDGKGGTSRARKLIELPDGSQARAVFSSNGKEVAAFVATEEATETEQTLTAISVATRRQRALAEGFSSSFGTVTTTIGSVIAWQPVPKR